MNKKNAITTVIIALLCVIIAILVGIIIFTNINTKYENKNINFTQFSESYETDNIDKLTIKSDYGDIKFIKSDDNKIHIEGNVSDIFRLSSSLSNGNLIVTRFGENKKLTDRNHFDISTIISLPEGYEGIISADTEYGNISAKEDLIGVVSLDTDYGNIEINKIEGSFTLSTDCGNISIDEAIITANSEADTDMGNVTIKKTNPVKIIDNAELGTNTINGSDSTSDITLKVDTDMGNININK